MAAAKRVRTPHLFSVLWASPTSLAGLALGTLAVLTGGGFRRTAGTLEFHGGALRLLPLLTPVRAAAMAIGHVIVAMDEAALQACRDHELVHVRQAEIWGPFFLPAYFSASALAWVRGGHFYRDNWFEIDARQSEAHVSPMTKP